MKITTKDNWRVVATIRPMRTHMSIASLGFKDEWGEPLQGEVVGDEFTITVEPHGPGWRSVGDWTFVVADEGEKGCQVIARGMTKHPNVIKAEIVCDETHTCSHCGYTWEVLSEDDVADPGNLVDLHSIAGEPVCCGKAIDEFRTKCGIPLPTVET